MWKLLMGIALISVGLLVMPDGPWQQRVLAALLIGIGWSV